ncbi:hypothetical protein MPSI1_002747 [Malassezia psittaci]|uniref:Golgi to ER traffic protein 4 n=1 Tax=Malassezia psittaci TaxID=1821823 RepID=A0AAF0JEJ2_9BASI|nr:hypothetical protein MPSI1_002747 [Malassezia psittaci]
MTSTVGTIDPSTVPGGSGGYELHQKIRTKTVRLLKKEKYAEAIQVLYDGSMKLLDMNEQGSGCDLAAYLLDAYKRSQTPVDDTSRSRITDILSKTNAEFWRKKVIQAAVQWSIDQSHNALGDAKLRLFIAELLAKDQQFYLAEGHYIAACASNQQGVPSFAAMLNRWNTSYATAIAETDSSNPSVDSVRRVLSGTFSLRGWIPLLIARAPEAALQFLHDYIKDAVKDNETLLLPVKPNPKEYKSPAMGISTLSTTIYATANPTLNFSQNAVALACDAQRQNGRLPEEIKAAWNQLVRQYMQENGSAIEPYLYEISATYFGMAPPRKTTDMLSSMLSGMMGGGNPSASGSEQPAVSVKQLPNPSDPRKSSGNPSEKPLQASEADDLMDDEMD